MTRQQTMTAVLFGAAMFIWGFLVPLAFISAMR